MLETGPELAVQVLVVGSLLRCTEKPRGSLKWARFYPEDVGDQIQFWPPRASCRRLARNRHRLLQRRARKAQRAAVE